MIALLIYPKKIDKKFVKEYASKSKTGINSRYGILKRSNICNKVKMYYGNAGYKTNKKFSDTKDKFSLWQK
ncbi:hypothetical protein MYP_2702 [Sporocytophaga myxococcoides]|uniref:Uncharacterized protein n=1 Tax=Sporocytophaga myxococcoides TaxID=153721 RepID=A0A098LH19_9BACT|nr:hypothetical protein [Sporocytophaga myxococcoides]GAL85473.1 hypothetical protein MYP_2702 [Sporocytophaga myxococcoides]